MNLESLRKLIKEEVEKQLDEADKASKSPPKTLGDFRKMVGAACKKAKAPKDFVEEILDVGNEGGGIPAALYDAFRNVELELKDSKMEPTEQWETVAYYVHDAIIDAASEYSNAWNYGPGRKATKFDPAALAQAVQDQIEKMGPPRPKRAPPNVPDTVKAKTVADIIADDLRTEGGEVKSSGDDLEATVSLKTDSPVDQVAGYLDEFITQKMGGKFLRVDGRVHEYEIVVPGGSAYIQVIPDTDRGGEVKVRVFSDEDKTTATT